MHERLNCPFVVTDDDVAGTFTFIRALEDHGARADLTAREIGETWLNYIVENRAILWWGGHGKSTEHTAWLNLRRGVEAPASGSIAVNGQTVAEQIGAASASARRCSTCRTACSTSGLGRSRRRVRLRGLSPTFVNGGASMRTGATRARRSTRPTATTDTRANAMSSPIMR